MNSIYIFLKFLFTFYIHAFIGVCIYIKKRYICTHRYMYSIKIQIIEIPGSHPEVLLKKRMVCPPSGGMSPLHHVSKKLAKQHSSHSIIIPRRTDHDFC